MDNQTEKENEYGTPVVDKLLGTFKQKQYIEKMNALNEDTRAELESIAEGVKKKLQEKQLKYFKIKSLKKLIKLLASEQRELRQINQSLHHQRRGVITALLNYYNKLRGKCPHAEINLKTYPHKHGYNAAKSFFTWHLF